MFAVIGLSLLAAGQLPSQQPDVSKPLSQLQGKWNVIGGEEVGHAITEKEVKKEPFVFTFKGDMLIIHRKGKVFGEFSVRVKPGKGKSEIDFKHKGGQYDGKTCHAIYLLKDDELKICTASKLREDEAKDRPTVFSSKKTTDEGAGRIGKLLFILKRDKK